jgi:hypothetical protein
VAGSAGCGVQSRFTSPAAILLGLLFCILLSACATTEPVRPYKLYPGPERQLAELAVVQMGQAGAAEFNGRPVSRRDWSEVHLLPGEHTVRWLTQFGASVMVEPSGFATGGAEIRVHLQAGETYRLMADRTTGYGYRMYFWIENATTGTVVAGTRKP